MDGITLRSAAAQGRWNHYEDPNPAGMWFLALRDLGPLWGFAVRPFEPGLSVLARVAATSGLRAEPLYQIGHRDISRLTIKQPRCRVGGTNHVWQ